MTTEGVRGLAEVLAVERFGCLCETDTERDGCDAYDDATAALAWFDARLGSGEVETAVTEAIWSAPRNGTSWDVAQVRAAAAVEAVRAALKEGE